MEIAVHDIAMESVLMYVINPDSYSFCATLIVVPTENHNLRDASCCKVDVVKGADGDFFAGFATTEDTEKLPSDAEVRKFLASSRIV